MYNINIAREYKQKKKGRGAKLMINNNINDRKEMAEEIGYVVKTFSIDIMDKKTILQDLKGLGYDYTAEYIKQISKKDYVNIILLIDAEEGAK